MNIIIAGGRDFGDFDLLCSEVDKFISRTTSLTGVRYIVSGTAAGADRLGEVYANLRGYRVRRFPADWYPDGKTLDMAAGNKRNKLMAIYGTHLVAFWDGASSGTADMIKQAKQRGLDVEVIRY